MLHYICNGGCKTLSMQEGECPVDTCPKFGEPLIQCTCIDGMHYGKLNRADEGDEIVSPIGDPPPYPQEKELTKEEAGIASTALLGKAFRLHWYEKYNFFRAQEVLFHIRAQWLLCTIRLFQARDIRPAILCYTKR